MTSNRTAFVEPGYYEDGQFGIRIENVMLVKEVKLEVRALTDII